LLDGSGATPGAGASIWADDPSFNPLMAIISATTIVVEVREMCSSA
jgi:hypothetical protein